MILTISMISDADQLSAINEKVAGLEWRDGKETAGAVAKAVKDNEQALMNSPEGQEIRAQLNKLILSHPVVRGMARPRKLTPLMISKTSGGGHYGAHVDNAMMAAGDAFVRTDMSFTLFLSDPSTYEGGELVIHQAGNQQKLKAQAGQMVIYPSSSIHEVRPVTSGVRIACIGWIESLVADPTQREILFDMENLRTSLRQKMDRNSVELITLDKSIGNLMRLWGNP